MNQWVPQVRAPPLGANLGKSCFPIDSLYMNAKLFSAPM